MSDDPTLELIAERLKSLRDLSEVKFEQLKLQIDSFKDLPGRVSKIETRMEDGMRRLGEVEKRESGNTNWRRSDLPLIMVTVGLLIVGLIQAIHG